MRRGRSTVAPFLLGALWSCAKTTEVVELPSLSGPTAVLLQLDGPAIVRATVHDLEAGRVIERIDAAENRALVLFVYEARPELLGLPVGPLKLTVETTPSQRSLPSRPADAFELMLDGSTEGWLALDPNEQTEISSRVLFEDQIATEGCPSFTTEQYTLDVAAHVTFAVRLDERTALLGTDETKEGMPDLVVGKLLRLDLDDPGNPHPVDRPAGLPILAAHFDGEWIWFFGTDGEIWRSRWSGSQLTDVERWGTTSRARSVRWAAGGPGPNPEIYTLSIGTTNVPSTIERFDGSAWSVIHELPPETRFRGYQDAVLRWLGPGHVIAGALTLPGLIHVRDGIAYAERPDDQGRSYSAVGEIPGLGAVVGSSASGLFFRFDGGSWSPLGPSNFALAPFSIAEHAEGFFVAGMTGATDYFRFERGFCPPNLIPRAAHTTRYLMPFQDRLIAFGDVPITSLQLPLTVFRPPSAPGG